MQKLMTHDREGKESSKTMLTHDVLDYKAEFFSALIIYLAIGAGTNSGFTRKVVIMLMYMALLFLAIIIYQRTCNQPILGGVTSNVRGSSHV